METYSSNEALQRILRVLNGDVIESAERDFYGQKAWDESLALIAQLIEGVTTGLRLPLDKWGDVWSWTGTATLTALSATAFTKITGTFQNNDPYLDVTPDWNDDRILVTDSGSIFRIDWSLSFVGSPALQYKIEPYYGGVGIPQAAASETPNTSGTYACASSFGFQYISGTNVAIDLRVLPSATGWMLPKQAMLMIRRVGPRVNEGTNGS